MKTSSSRTDHTYQGSPIDYNGSERYLPPSEVTAVITSQSNPLRVRGDAGVNESVN